MNSIHTGLDKFNKVTKLHGFQVFLFLSSQLLCIILAISSLQYIKTREQLIADIQMQRINITFKDRVSKIMDTVSTFSTEVGTRLMYKTDWHKLSTNEGYTYLQNIKPKALPEVHRIVVFDSSGDQILASYAPSFNPVNVADRPYFTSLKNSVKDQYLYGPYVSRTEGKTSYAVVNKLVTPSGDFDGVAVTGIDLEALQSHCLNIIPTEGYNTYLVNQHNEIILHCSFMRNSPYTKIKTLSDVFNDPSFSAFGLSEGQVNYKDYVIYSQPILGGSLRTLTVVKRDIIYSSLDGLVWQNYLLLMVALLTQVLCFMIFNNILTKYSSLLKRSLLKRAN